MKKLVLGLSLTLLLLVGAGSAYAQTSGAVMSSHASISGSLALGAKGDAVTTLQQFLITKGYLHATASTGFYGNLTAKAVSDFQAANNLPQVGRVGPKTLVLINAQILAQPTSDTQSNSSNGVAVDAGVVVNTPPMSVPTSPCSGEAMYNSVTGALCSAQSQQIAQLQQQQSSSSSCSGMTPSITVTSPNGGETDTAGQSLVVTWTSCNIPASTLINISLNDPNDGGVALLSSGTANTGSAPFIIPSSVPTGQYKIAIKTLLSFGPYFDESDNLFTVNGQQTNQAITLVQPSNQANWTGGSPYTISWTSGTGSVTLAACSTVFSNTGLNPQQCVTITSNQSASGSYTYTLPSGNSNSSGQVEIRATDSSHYDSHMINVSGSSLLSSLGNNG